MSELPPIEDIDRLFDSDTHYDVTDKLFDIKVGNTVKVLSNNTYSSLIKKYGSVWMSASENIVYLSLLELWLASGRDLQINSKDVVALTVGGETTLLPLAVSGLRTVIDAFVTSCRDGNLVEDVDPEREPNPFFYSVPLIQNGNLAFYADYYPVVEEEKPLNPSKIFISSAITNI